MTGDAPFGVLVTGATTPFGRALCQALAAHPQVNHVVAVGLEPLGQPIPLESGKSGVGEFHYVAMDLMRSRQVRDLLWGPARDCRVVVHAAQHRSAMAIGRRAHRLNVEATIDLLEMVEEHPTMRRFIFRSSGAVYRIDARQPSIIDERQPLNLDARAPQWIRDRVAADLTVCTRMGMSTTSMVVLRSAECVAPHMGSQFYDFLSAPVCFRPLGFDPIINVISMRDMVQATVLAVMADCHGVYNIPGYDTLSLATLIRLCGHAALAAPGFVMAPLYRARAWAEGSEFRYDLNHWRFHFNGTLSGERAAEDLGYQPQFGVDWSCLRSRGGARSTESA